MNKVQSAEDLASRIEASSSFPGHSFHGRSSSLPRSPARALSRRLRQSRLRPLGRPTGWKDSGIARRGRHFIPARSWHDADPRHRGE